MQVRDNWYRDVWLFILSVLMLLSILFGYTANRNRIADVQQQRLETCQRQNARHYQALLVASRGEIHNRELVKSLLNAIVPVQDCRALIPPPSITPGP